MNKSTETLISNALSETKTTIVDLSKYLKLINIDFDEIKYKTFTPRSTQEAIAKYGGFADVPLCLIALTKTVPLAKKWNETISILVANTIPKTQRTHSPTFNNKNIHRIAFTLLRAMIDAGYFLQQNLPKDCEKLISEHKELLKNKDKDIGIALKATDVFINTSPLLSLINEILISLKKLDSFYNAVPKTTLLSKPVNFTPTAEAKIQFNLAKLAVAKTLNSSLLTKLNTFHKETVTQYTQWITDNKASVTPFKPTTELDLMWMVTKSTNDLERLLNTPQESSNKKTNKSEDEILSNSLDITNRLIPAIMEALNIHPLKKAAEHKTPDILLHKALAISEVTNENLYAICQKLNIPIKAIYKRDEQTEGKGEECEFSIQKMVDYYR